MLRLLLSTDIDADRVTNDLIPIDTGNVISMGLPRVMLLRSLCTTVRSARPAVENDHSLVHSYLNGLTMV